MKLLMRAAAIAALAVSTFLLIGSSQAVADPLERPSQNIIQAKPLQDQNIIRADQPRFS